MLLAPWFETGSLTLPQHIGQIHLIRRLGRVFFAPRKSRACTVLSSVDVSLSCEHGGTEPLPAKDHNQRAVKPRGGVRTKLQRQRSMRKRSKGPSSRNTRGLILIVCSGSQDIIRATRESVRDSRLRPQDCVSSWNKCSGSTR